MADKTTKEQKTPVKRKRGQRGPAKKPKKLTKAERWAIQNDKELQAYLATMARRDDDNDDNVPRDAIGRPSVMTSTVLRRLEQAFLIGCTDREAFNYAGISETTFYDYCKKHPDFAELKERLKEEPIYAARLNIVRALKNGSIADSWNYMRAKRKDEFAPKVIQEVEAAMTAEELEKINKGDIQEIDDMEDKDVENT